MAEIRIISRPVERKACVCGGALTVSQITTDKRNASLWLCTRHCGARGLTYPGALRRKVRLDLLKWGDLRRNARALAESAEEPQVIVVRQKAQVEPEPAAHC
jgi:hypothetical protein